MAERTPTRDRALTVRMAAAMAVLGLVYCMLPLIGLLGIVVGLVLGDIGMAGEGLVLIGLGMGALAWGSTRLEAAALTVVGARVVDPSELPDVHERLVRLSAQADLPTPRLALVDSASPNAFAVGARPERAVLVVTRGLLDILTPGELEAVIAHELAHFVNRDGIVMTLARVPAVRGSDREHTAVRALGVALIAPIYLLALLLMLTISRHREFAADRGAVLITGAPEQLMSALQKLAGVRAQGDLRRGGVAISALCIVPTRTSRIGLFRDHPPLRQRLARLAALARRLGKAA